jgi:cytoskeleton protein RodZ
MASSADEAAAAAVSEPSGSTDIAAAAVTGTATTDAAETAAVDEVASAPAAPGETVAASSSAATEEPTLPVVEADYVPKVYGRTNLDARVVITAVDDSWVQVMGPDNELLLTRILRAGDSYRVPDRPGLVMVTGNAGGLEVRVDDAIAPTLGPLGVVLRNIALEPDRLLAGTATSG